MLNLKQEEAIHLAVHKNVVLLLKDYALKGYQQTQGKKTEDFERLWRLAFQATEGESISPAKQHSHTLH